MSDFTPPPPPPPAYETSPKPGVPPAKSRRGLWVGLGSCLALVIIALAIIFLTIVAINGGSKKDESIGEKSAGVPPIEATTTTQTPVEKGPAPTCAFAGADSSSDMQVDLTFTNTLGDVNGIEVTFALIDGKDGTRFYTGTAGGIDTVDLEFPVANEQFRLSARTLKELPPDIEATTISCKVLAIEEAMDIGRLKRATGADTCTVLGTDSSGYVQVKLAVSSPYADIARVQTWWALQGPGGVRFDTGTDVVDLVGAGETFQIIPLFSKKRPSWIGDGEVTCVVRGFWDQGR
ncbi:MAG: hypothetical protein WCG62_05025 [Actinomycetes bacterium]